MMTQIEGEKICTCINMYLLNHLNYEQNQYIHPLTGTLYGNFIIFDDVMTPFDKICHNL